ncbi:MAG: alpha-1,2-fucosyltransferase [Lachnospiraceae bacterium]
MNVVKISDGLGNQMFQYAFARKIQIQRGSRVYLDTRFINNEDRITRGEKRRTLERNDVRKYGLNHFRVRLPVANENILAKWSFINAKNQIDQVLFVLAQEGLWIWQFKDDSQKGKGKIWAAKDCFFPTYFQGYHFDLRYYEDIKEILQKEFMLKIPIKLSKKWYWILHNENTVSLHVRRGDYLKLHCEIRDEAYYTKAMKIIEEQISHPFYLIFSDDIEWVKENIHINGEKLYISGRGFADYEELTIMKHCRHNIIANSTFSYWAAYLNSNPDKIVICPRRWMSEIIPREWIRV